MFPSQQDGTPCFVCVVQRLFIPGDNDVGGEGFDQRTQTKIARFFAEQELLSNSHVTHLTSLRKLKFVDFILVRYQTLYHVYYLSTIDYF